MNATTVGNFTTAMATTMPGGGPPGPPPFFCGASGSIINGTCVCDPGYFPPGPCLDVFFWDSAEFNIYTMFFMIAFTALAFISAYEFLYSLFKKDLKISMFYVSRLITFAFGLVGIIYYADIPRWTGLIPQPPTDQVGGIVLQLLLSVFFFLSTSACLASNWILFFKRNKLIESQMGVYFALGLIWGLVVVIFFIAVSGVALNLIGTNIGVGASSQAAAVVYAASLLQIIATAVWAVILFCISAMLFTRIRSISLNSQSKFRLFLKLFIGTFCGAALALSYAAYVFYIQIVDPPNILLLPNFLKSVTTRSWIAQSLNLAIAVCTMWIMRPTHEYVDDESKNSQADDAVSKRSATTPVSDSAMSFTMEIDD